MPSSLDNIIAVIRAQLGDAPPTMDIVRLVAKPWGQEVVLSVPGGEVKYIEVDDDARTSLQHHMIGTDVIVILSGEGTVEGTPDELLDKPRPSPAYVVRPGTRHRSVGPVTLLELTTAGPDDIVRHEDDHGREGTTGR